MQAINFKNIYLITKFLMLTTLLTSCGGGGSSSDVLSGTVATGAALVGVVNVYGSNGGEILDVEIDTSGQYSVDVSGLASPYFLAAIPNNSSFDSQYSYASGSGIINITPLTTLALFIANNEQSPEQLSALWPAAASNILANTADAQAAINANFINLFPLQNIDFTTFDFLTTFFAIGGAFDQILDQISVDISNNSPIVTISENSAFTFNPNIDISSINNGGSNDTGSSNDTGNFGSLAISGVDTSLLIDGLSFSPTINVPAFGSSNEGVLTWGDLNSVSLVIGIENGSPTVIKLTKDDFVVDFSTNSGQRITYQYELACFLENVDCSSLQVDINNKTIAFQNLVLPPKIEGVFIGNSATAPITLNGTLSW